MPGATHARDMNNLGGKRLAPGGLARKDVAPRLSARKTQAGRLCHPIRSSVQSSGKHPQAACRLDATAIMSDTDRLPKSALPSCRNSCQPRVWAVCCCHPAHAAPGTRTLVPRDRVALLGGWIVWVAPMSRFLHKPLGGNLIHVIPSLVLPAHERSSVAIVWHLWWVGGSLKDPGWVPFLMERWAAGSGWNGGARGRRGLLRGVHPQAPPLRASA